MYRFYTVFLFVGRRCTGSVMIYAHSKEGAWRAASETQSYECAHRIAAEEGTDVQWDAVPRVSPISMY